MGGSLEINSSASRLDYRNIVYYMIVWINLTLRGVASLIPLRRARAWVFRNYIDHQPFLH